MNDEHPTHSSEPISADATSAAQRAADDERREGRESARLGIMLRDARERAGLGLSDLAEVTHVRRVYLSALEEGRFADLPEDVYARNFVRLYASAVGLEAAPLLERYSAERGRALGRTTLEQRLDRDRAAASELRTSPTPAAARRTPRRAPAWLAGPLLPTLGLIVVVVGLAVWGYNGLFAGTAPGPGPTAGANAASPDAPATTPASPDATSPSASLAAPADASDTAADPATPVRVSIVTTPPGASISIDGFPVPGVTPLVDIPVTARAGRVVRAELDGYAPSEVRADVLSDTEVSLTLEPVGAAGPTAAAAGAAGTLLITITDTTWLEVYRSTARNEGERLVYTTAQPGASYSFEPPLFVYTGNAAGVRLTLDGQDLGAMGSPGAVLGRAFPE